MNYISIDPATYSDPPSLDEYTEKSERARRKESRAARLLYSVNQINKFSRERNR